MEQENNLEEEIEKCMWKQTRNNDMEMCGKCDGYDTKCPTYVAPTKVRLWKNNENEYGRFWQ